MISNADTREDAFDVSVYYSVFENRFMLLLPPASVCVWY